MERLQKVIASAGVASRRKAEQLIQEGKVSVNGKIVTEMGIKVSPEDEIKVNGKPLQKEEKVYYLLNKPKGYICAVSDDKDRKTVIDCFPDVKERIFPVGRLDYDTTGLLILTNDGEFANKMMHPRYHLPKTYEVAVDGVLTDQMLTMLQNGIELEDGKTLPAEVYLLKRLEGKKKTEIQITIFEGRNRQVRKMCQAARHPVATLRRVAEGEIYLGELKKGEWRYLTNKEIRYIKEL